MAFSCSIDGSGACVILTGSVISWKTTAKVKRIIPASRGPPAEEEAQEKGGKPAASNACQRHNGYAGLKVCNLELLHGMTSFVSCYAQSGNAGAVVHFGERRSTFFCGS